MLQKSQHGKMFCVWGDLCILCASCINEITDYHMYLRFCFVLYYTAVLLVFFFHIILFLVKDISWYLSR